MKFWHYLGFLVSLILAYECPAQFTKVETMKRVEAIIKDTLKVVPQEKREKILVLFDVDGVLLRSANTAKEISAIYQFKSEWKKLFSPLSPLDQDLVLTKSIIQDKTLLVEETTPEVLQTLLKQGVTVIAFTSFLVGKMNDISSLESYRYNDLKEKGIDFSASFPEMNRYEFKSLPMNRGYFPVYYQGILQANGRTVEASGKQQTSEDAKALVLPAFLEHANYEPEVIIFIDDSDKHIKALEKVLTKLKPGLKFIGIHYTAALKIDASKVTKEEFIRTWKTIIDEVKSTETSTTKALA